MKKIICLLVVCLMATCLTFGCTGNDEEVYLSGNDAWAPITERQAGKIVGIAPELCTDILKELGFSPRCLYRGNWDKIQLSLTHSKLDAIVAINKTVGLNNKYLLTDVYMVFENESFCMAISQDSPLAKKIPEINTLIATYKQDGRLEKIKQKYGL